MPYQIALERFQGPLDLLLQLIERQELNISEVSLGAVTEQYLQYLEQEPDLPPEELADFLVVAAKLLLLKSRLLLPELFVEEEEEGESLAEQLAAYRRYVEASRRLAARLRRGQFSYARDRLPVAATATFSPPPDLTAEALRAVFSKMLTELAEFVRPLPELMRRTVSLQDKIAGLRRLLEGGAAVDFHVVLRSASSRLEIIVSFLALLELVKQRYVVARQAGHGETIVLQRLEPRAAGGAAA